MAWVRLSPGVYKNDVTGEVRKGQAKRPTDEGAAAAPAPAPAAVPTIPQVPAGTKLDTPADVINTTNVVGQGSQVAGNTLTNPNQVNPFGSQTVTYDPVTGQPTVNQTLSNSNQQVLGGIQKGATGANNALNSIFSGGTFSSLNNPSKNGKAAPMSNYEQAIFNQSTSGVADQQKRDLANTEQTLANRGIPQGSELYNDQMKQVNDRYDKIFQDARSGAVTSGVNATMSAIPTLSSVGNTGFMSPSFQNFQAVQYQQPDVNSIYNTATQKNLTQQQIDAAKKKSGGGGGSSSAPKQTSAFVTS